MVEGLSVMTTGPNQLDWWIACQNRFMNLQSIEMIKNAVIAEPEDIPICLVDLAN